MNLSLDLSLAEIVDTVPGAPRVFRVVWPRPLLRWSEDAARGM
jgi:hypothetical protein